MAATGKPPARREDEILRDLRAERERLVTALEDLGDDVQSAAEEARGRVREASGKARRAAPAAGAAVASLLLAALLVRRRRRDGRS